MNTGVGLFLFKLKGKGKTLQELKKKKEKNRAGKEESLSMGIEHSAHRKTWEPSVKSLGNVLNATELFIKKGLKRHILHYVCFTVKKKFGRN